MTVETKRLSTITWQYSEHYNMYFIMKYRIFNGLSDGIMAVHSTRGTSTTWYEYDSYTMNKKYYLYEVVGWQTMVGMFACLFACYTSKNFITSVVCHTTSTTTILL